MQYSLATTVFNNQDEIIDFLNNICNQSVKPAEIIVADGGSKDDTVKLVENYASACEIPVVVLSGKRMNISEGFNAAIKTAQCDFVAVGAVGNKYPADYFESMLKCFENNVDADVVCSNLKGIKTTTFSEFYCDITLPEYAASISGNHGLMFKQSLFTDIGYFYEKFVYAGEDEEFLQRIVNSGKNIFFIEDLFVEWDVPHNLKEYKKQLSVYLLALLEIYENNFILSFYKREVVYVGLVISSLILSLIPYLNILGLILLLLLVGKNIKSILKNNIKICGYRNLKFFMDVKNLIKYRKYLKNQNKIDEKYRLDSRKDPIAYSKKVKKEI